MIHKIKMVKYAKDEISKATKKDLNLETNNFYKSTLGKIKALLTLN